ncbi:hypothetical protein KKC1_26390 [Calderihabitans maritimus]|uniref:Uncharacterized protein n=1 Tax=Calderihabitans maritimus TaxID=1246530 RepID=A0A1Z5HVS7_9FIRM|nr:hypothetical protein KKC1_26390 [Calderihabitans maritimus]
MFNIGAPEKFQYAAGKGKQEVENWGVEVRWMS